MHSLVHLCNANNEENEEDWIVKVENKLSKRISEGELQKDNEHQGERAKIASVKKKFMIKEVVPIAGKINAIEKKLFL